jgi:hypothetical protein
LLEEGLDIDDATLARSSGQHLEYLQARSMHVSRRHDDILSVMQGLLESPLVIAAARNERSKVLTRDRPHQRSVSPRV